jgi:hypothetical protein
MTMLRVAIGVVWALSFVAGRDLWLSPAASANTATSAEFTVQACPHPRGVTEGSLVETGDSREARDPEVDLFGNEVEPAIADYRVDLRGTIYERHSPETAVARLGSPST